MIYLYMDMLKRAIIFPIIIFFLATVATLSAQPHVTVGETIAWNNYSPSHKYKTVTDWIEKASNRILWSHEARMDFALTAYKYSMLLEDYNLKMKAMLALAELHFNEGQFDIALSYLDTLKLHATATNNTALSVKTDNFISSISRYRGDIFEALGLSYEAYIKAKQNKLTGLAALSANNLGIIYRSLGENKLALDYYNLAMEHALEAADTNQLITSYSGIGNFYWYEKKPHEATGYYEMAMHLAQKSNDLQHIASTNNNLGNIARGREEYTKALEHYTTAYSLLEQIQVTGLKAVIIRNMGLVYKNTGDYANALMHIHESLEIATNIGVGNIIRDNHLTLSQLYELTGNIEEAHKHLLKYTEINQEINNKQLTNRISYYNDKVFNAERNQEVYKYKLRNNLYILIIVALVLASMILFSVFIYSRSQERRKQFERLKNTLQDKIIIEKALRQSEENYHTLIKTLNEGLIVLDKNNRIEFLNLKASNILGSNEKNELLGRAFEEFLLTREDEKLFLEKVELQKMGISDHYEIKMKNVNGDVLWAYLSSAPILDENLKTKGCVALISDVTEKKKSEQTYSELTANLNQKIKQLNCLYDITDISGVPGISFEEIMEKSLEIIPVGLRYSHDIGVQIVFDNKTYSSKNFIDSPWSYQVPIKVQKKKLGYIKVAYTEEKPNINKDPFHFNEKILLKNISEKFGKIIESKNMERILRENQEKLQEVQRIAKIGNWEKDFSSNIYTFSDTFFDIADIAHERRKFFDNNRLVEIIHPDDKEIFLDFERKLVKQGDNQDVTTNYRIITGDGTIKFIFSSGKLIYDDQKNKTGCVITVQDITEQKYTQELQHHAELALKTSEAKQQVVANLSYEMRTPITGIMGMVDFLLETNLDASQMELAKTIKVSSIGLLNSINNILDLQRIEAGKIKLNNTMFSLSQLMAKISSLFTALTRNKEISLELKIDKDIPESIVSDQDRLYQVITSLVAILTESATGKGKIIIHLRRHTTVGSKMGIVVEITDNFSNINIDEINNLLYPSKTNGAAPVFHKNDSINVGLAISRKLVDLLEGKIWVEKNKLNGTSFSFSFHTTMVSSDFYNTDMKSSQEKIIKKLKGVKVLCVEDQKINQKVVSLMLSHAQCKVTMANNGKEALEMLAIGKYDIILLDMVMPVMDGMETLRIIKQNLVDYPPVIAFSANVLDEDKEKYYLAGIQDFISKPINADELYFKIEKWHKKNKTTGKLKKVK